MTDFNKRVEFQLSCQWTDVTTLLIVWFVISIVLKEKKVKKNNRVDTIIQDIRVCSPQVLQVSKVVTSVH